MAERIREQIATVRLRELPGLRLTSSIGLAEATDRQLQLRDWINDADAALYRAKHLGRNTVVLAGDFGGGREPVADPQTGRLF